MTAAQIASLGLIGWQIFLLAQGLGWNNPLLSVFGILGAIAILAPRKWKLPVPLSAIGCLIAIVGSLVTAYVYRGESPLASMFRFFSAFWVQGFGLGLLGCQVVSLFTWTDRNTLPRWLIPVVFATSFCALDQSFVFGPELFYVVIGTLAILIPFAAISAVHRLGPASSSRTTRHESVLTVALLGLVGLGTWSLIDAWSLSLPEVQTWFVRTVGRRMQTTQSLRVYVNSGNLNAVLTEMSIDSNRTALRVFSEERPGYLAGRKFDVYSNGRWSLFTDRVRRRSEELLGFTMYEPVDSSSDDFPAAPPGLKTFELATAPAQTRLSAFRVQNDPRRGPVYFSPLGTSLVQGAGSSLAVDDQRIIRRGIRVSNDYVLHANAKSIRESLSDEARHRYLAIPPDLSGTINNLSNRIAGRQTGFNEKVFAISNYFQTQYEYSLDEVRTPKGADPLEYFLTTRDSGHCEFFASGAVMLLRAQGIPARYATGFRVMDLEEENEDYWIARNRNAHAWAEAYDESQERWYIVEATPGFYYREDDPSATRSAQRRSGQNQDAFAGQTSAEKFLDWILRSVDSFGALSVILFAVGMGFTLVLVFRRSNRSLDQMTHVRLSPEVRLLRRRLLALDRRLKRYGLRRAPAETLHCFADRVQGCQELTAEQRLEFATHYRDYAAARYGRTILPVS